MTFRRATPKERAKYGKANIIRGRNKPISGPPPRPRPAPWSEDAVQAADASELARPQPSMIVLNVILRDCGNLRGFFDLHLPHWHFTIHGCAWFRNLRGEESVGLPKQKWINPNNGEVKYFPMLTFSDVYSQRFENAALYALHTTLTRMPQSVQETSEDIGPWADNVTSLHFVEGDDPPFC